MSHPSENDLRALLAGELPAPESERLASHLDACESCREVAERLTEVPRELWATLVVASEVTDAPGVPVPPAPEIPGFADLAEIGRGGCGVVYRATETVTGRTVAMKVLRGGSLASASEHAWFLGEARAAANLRHPNLVTVLAVGEERGLPYYAMEYLPGGSLADRLDGTPLPPGEAARLVGAVAGAVQYAHGAGVIHRDLKPGNILLDGPPAPGPIGTPRVSDFGMAKREGADLGRTPTHAVLGTPSYMAPEQALGRSRDAGPRADIYALGAVLYELLTGRPPFRGASPYETLLLVRDEEPVPPGRLRRGLPKDIETICLKCLEKDPGRRYATADDLADDLDAFRQGRPVAARPVGRLARLARWARRNPAVAAPSAMSIVLVAAMLTLITIFWRRAEAQRAELAESVRAADLRGRTLLAALAFSAEATSKLALHPALLSEVEREAIINGLDVFERVPDLPGSPDEEGQFAYATLQMGTVLHSLRELGHSERVARRAMRTLERLRLEHPDRPVFALHYAYACMQLAGLAHDAGRTDEMMNHHAEAVRATEEAASRYPHLDAYAAELANFRGRLAADLVDIGRGEEAEPLLEQSLATNRELVNRYPDDPERYRYYNEASFRYGRLLLRRHGAVDRYWDLARERMDLCDRARTQKDWHLIATRLTTIPQVAGDLDQFGRPQEADRVMRHGIAVLEELAARESAAPSDRTKLVEWLTIEGFRRWEADRAAAGRLFRRAVEILESLRSTPFGVAASGQLADLVAFCPDPAIRDPARGLACLRQVPRGPDFPWSYYGIILCENGEFAAARESLERFFAAPREDHEWDEAARLHLALAFKKLGDRDRAKAEMEKARADREACFFRGRVSRAVAAEAMKLLAD
ncbi:protein kinase domain-containing protein [Aquisphaera insulae]|uniref:protein kinase domain-containing protein n=1 Tax=Aquisphaera insulae TaxID=2712864 RepID=UPI0013EC22F8|nr:protein kinase [Aquisphaera insulae]